MPTTRQWTPIQRAVSAWGRRRRLRSTCRVRVRGALRHRPAADGDRLPRGPWRTPRGAGAAQEQQEAEDHERQERERRRRARWIEWVADGGVRLQQELVEGPQRQRKEPERQEHDEADEPQEAQRVVEDAEAEEHQRRRWHYHP